MYGFGFVALVDPNMGEPSPWPVLEIHDRRNAEHSFPRPVPFLRPFDFRVRHRDPRARFHDNAMRDMLDPTLWSDVRDIVIFKHCTDTYEWFAYDIFTSISDDPYPLPTKPIERAFDACWIMKPIPPGMLAL
jgi:hypothetical protein